MRHQRRARCDSRSKKESPALAPLCRIVQVKSKESEHGRAVIIAQIATAFKKSHIANQHQNCCESRAPIKELPRNQKNHDEREHSCYEIEDSALQHSPSEYF